MAIETNEQILDRNLDELLLKQIRRVRLGNFGDFQQHPSAFLQASLDTGPNPEWTDEADRYDFVRGIESD